MADNNPGAANHGGQPGDPDPQAGQHIADALVAKKARMLDAPVSGGVNGAEAEVIEGLDKESHRVDIIFVAAPYSIDGVSARTTCERLLLERGFSVIPPSNSGMIYARNENHQTK